LWAIESLKYGDKDVLVIDVPRRPRQPYVVEGAIYLRRGERNVPANRDEISALIQRRVESSRRWERQIAVGVQRGDLRDELVKETIRLAVNAKTLAWFS
jgi:predicted HTH transcriptional regulator